MDAALYVRISEVGQSSFSLDAQLAACRQYAEQHGWRVVAEYVERGQSARTADRPEFQRMIAAAKAGQFQVIVVHKLDRFARNREDAVTYKALLRRVGIVLESVAEDFDDGPMGRLVEGILECVADWFLANLKEETNKGMIRMAQSGLWPSRPPIGYERIQDGSKRLAHEAPHAAQLAAAFQEFATGKYTLRTWAKEAHRRGYTERSGKRIAPGRWSRIFNHRIYLGRLPWDGEEYDGQHEAITDPETWDRVQATLSANNGRLDRSRASKPQRRTYLLSRRLWSLDADSPMSGQTVKGRYQYYFSTEPLGDGSRHRVPCDVIHAQLPAILQNVVIEPDHLAGLDLPAKVLFGLRVADNAAPVFDSLDDVKTRRRFLAAVIERIGITGETISLVKVRPPFATNGANPDGVQFKSVRYPRANSNIFAHKTARNPQKLWILAA